MSLPVAEKSYLPQPSNCDSCGSLNVAFATNDIIYGVKRGDWPWCYYCIDCRAGVGCHPNTTFPLGTMADKETRLYRLKAHNEFDKLWAGEDRFMTRTKAYQWLAEQLNIGFEDCHMGQLSLDQLRTTIDLVKVNYEELKRIYIRRGKRQQARFNKRVKRKHRGQNIES